jgi:V/A-type H+-transporting ATPase subunit I
MAAGGLGVLLFASPDRPWPWRLVHGVLAITQVPQAFGDVLSYLRLFALGLATASLAVTFNQLAGDVAAASPGFGMLGALLILLLGHGLNFALAVMSGFVHGLRLNYIEFFNWGLPGEGRPFRPFAKREGMTWTQSS